jgi:hypothetical protein
MAKVLVLYYSSYGHIETMAGAVAEGVREGGAQATVKRVPETVPEEVARKSGFKLEQKAPVASLDHRGRGWQPAALESRAGRCALPRAAPGAGRGEARLKRRRSRGFT